MSGTDADDAAPVRPHQYLSEVGTLCNADASAALQQRAAMLTAKANGANAGEK